MPRIFYCCSLLCRCKIPQGAKGKVKERLSSRDQRSERERVEIAIQSETDRQTLLKRAGGLCKGRAGRRNGTKKSDVRLTKLPLTGGGESLSVPRDASALIFHCIYIV